MLRSSLTRKSVRCAKHTNRASHRLHQYHSHPAFSVPTLAPNPTLKSSPANSTSSNSRLQQLSYHFSTINSQSPIANMAGYRTRKIGQPFTLEHRVYIEDSHGNVVSPFHDIPLYANEQQTVLNMIVEIPRWTNAKMEVSCVSLSSISLNTKQLIATNHRSPRKNQ